MRFLNPNYYVRWGLFLFVSLNSYADGPTFADPSGAQTNGPALSVTPVAPTPFGAIYPVLPDGTLVLCDQDWSGTFGMPLPNKVGRSIIDSMIPHYGNLHNGVTAEWLVEYFTEYSSIKDKFDQRDYMAKHLPAAQAELKRIKQFKSVKLFLQSSVTSVNYDFTKNGYPCYFNPLVSGVIMNYDALPRFVAVPPDTARQFQTNGELIVVAKGELVFDEKSGENMVAAKIKIQEATIHIMEVVPTPRETVLDAQGLLHEQGSRGHRILKDVTLQTLRNLPEPKKHEHIAP